MWCIARVTEQKQKLEWKDANKSVKSAIIPVMLWCVTLAAHMSDTVQPTPWSDCTLQELNSINVVSQQP